MFRFIKGHGLGNDFLILEGEGLASALSEERVRAICDRRRGIGADGILILEEGRDGLPFMRIFNADGSQPEMCGNGLRVFALYLVQNLGYAAADLRIDTPAGIRSVHVWASAQSASGDIRVDMGCAAGAKDLVKVEYEGGGSEGAVSGVVVSMGNPHFVIVDDNCPVTEKQARSLGPILEFHSAFPHGTNVEFVERVAPGALRVFVWERGCGLTQACGTGACAAVVVAAREGRVDFNSDVKVSLPGGELVINVESGSERVWMTGPAVLVGEGELRI